MMIMSRMSIHEMDKMNKDILGINSEFIFFLIRINGFGYGRYYRELC